MEFIFLHKTELYLVAKTNELDLIKDILNQIIAKETLIKDQINNFLSDKIKNNVFFTTTERPIKIPTTPLHQILKKDL